MLSNSSKSMKKTIYRSLKSIKDFSTLEVSVVIDIENMRFSRNKVFENGVHSNSYNFHPTVIKFLWDPNKYILYQMS